MGFREDILHGTQDALTPLRNPVRAAGAQKYMKDIAPFLGVATDDRRAALRPVFTAAGTPTSKILGNTAMALMQLQEREFHYAAYDLIERFNAAADGDFLADFGERLLTTKSWWDTVDGIAATTSGSFGRPSSTSVVDEEQRTSNTSCRYAIRTQRVVSSSLRRASDGHCATSRESTPRQCKSFSESTRNFHQSPCAKR